MLCPDTSETKMMVNISAEISLAIMVRQHYTGFYNTCENATRDLILQ